MADDFPEWSQINARTSDRYVTFFAQCPRCKKSKGSHSAPEWMISDIANRLCDDCVAREAQDAVMVDMVVERVIAALAARGLLAQPPATDAVDPADGVVTD